MLLHSGRWHQPESVLRFTWRILSLGVVSIAYLMLGGCSGDAPSNTVIIGNCPADIARVNVDGICVCDIEGYAYNAMTETCIYKGSSCGDGQCLDGETQASCCEDCQCPNGQICAEGSCVAVCGDSECSSLETCMNCPSDCGACESIDTFDATADVANNQLDADADADSQSSCECTAGACCTGCTFKSSGAVCDTEVDYSCPWGTAPGGDVGRRTRNRVCSGSSSSCTGGYTNWSSYTVHDSCTTLEVCRDNDPTCNQRSCSCSTGTCCDGCNYRSSSYYPGT